MIDCKKKIIFAPDKTHTMLNQPSQNHQTNTQQMQSQQKHYSAAYEKNVKDIENKLGIKQGKEMTFLEANEQRVNPNYRKGGGFTINCQSCVVAYELRRRGFDVSAQENTQKKDDVPYELSHKTEAAWIDENGNIPIKL